MQGRVACHEELDALEIVTVDGPLELADFLEGIGVGLELRPAGKPMETCDLELRVGKGFRATGHEKIFGLILQVAEVGALRKRTPLMRGIGRHATSFRSTPVVRISGRKKVRKNRFQTGGLLPFPRTGGVPNAKAILPYVDGDSCRRN